MWVKICGVTSVEEALQVANEGPEALGLNFCEASPRFLTEERGREICEALSTAFPAMERVGVFVDFGKHPDDVIDFARRVGLTCVQLHGDEPPESMKRVAEAGMQVVKALRVGREDRMEDVLDEVQRYLEASGQRGRVLVDARVPGAHGGTGKRIDPDLVRALTRRARVIVAGGLRPENVSEVLSMGEGVAGVDVASGVENAQGRKDLAKVRAFMQAARGAFERQPNQHEGESDA